MAAQSYRLSVIIRVFQSVGMLVQRTEAIEVQAS